MMSVLFFGFLIGLRHALEADHVMAVTVLTTNQAGTRAIWQGTAWGIGHTVTLMLFGMIFLFMDSLVPEQFAQSLEFAVGIMLLILGTDIIRQVCRNRLHVHSHQHADGKKHFHLHSHSHSTHEHPKSHQHRHLSKLPIRALLVGLMHGMAGSGALIILTLQTVQYPLMGIFYILIFGVGSLVGMALLTTVIAIPINNSLKNFKFLHHSLRAIVGISTIILGTYIMFNIGITDGLLLN